jgi:putative hydrolase of the HAD superfamily
MLKALLFDFGGVIAEEGFREGLKAIGIKNGIDPDDFYKICEDIIYESGYVTGLKDEHSYWNMVRERTKINGSDEELRGEILSRFILRSEMLEYVRKLKASGFFVAILSDQTNWLDEINKRMPFYNNFDFVFNSYKIKKSKREPSVFRDVCSEIGVAPSEVLFIDDNIRNILTAQAERLQTLHYMDFSDFIEKLKVILQNEDI